MKYLLQICTSVITVLLLVVCVSMTTTSCSKDILSILITKISDEHDVQKFDEHLHLPDKLWVTLVPGVNKGSSLPVGFMPEKDEMGNVQIGNESFDKLSI